jgi:uncharacterized phage protein (TIGR01671 family)
MREIKFRGKHIETGRWVYGYYVCTHNRHRIIYEDYEGFYCEEEVIPETVGQYTGLKDRNGTEIFEGDLLFDKDELTRPFIVKWDDEWAQFYVDCGEGSTDFLWKWANLEVIGNIYENFEKEERKGG